MSAVELQLDQLRRRYPDATATPLASGATLITVPNVRLPAGWSKTQTDIRFIAPAGYPFAALDCFWADGDLRLDGGANPGSSGTNPIPDVGGEWLWFSWHLTGGWNANRDNFVTWMNSVKDRLRRVQ